MFKSKNELPAKVHAKMVEIPNARLADLRP
jgi:hypothetical protein